MKLALSYSSLIIATIVSIMSCSKILDKSPQDKFSDVVVFSDINLADRYLLDTYNQSLIGAVGYISFASLTDESHDTHGFRTANYLLGNISPSSVLPFGRWSFNYVTWDGMYKNIQRLNVFLANIDRVSEAYPEAEQAGVKERSERMKGEATFLRAFCYLQLTRNWGGAILATEPFEVGGNLLDTKRATFAESVDFIVSECDKASSLLGVKSETEMGRATKEAAMALKSRILLFAASDLTADGNAANDLVGYSSADRTALWTAAKNAAKAVIDLGTYKLADFGAPDQSSVSQKYFEFFKAKDLSNDEVIWGKLFRKDGGPRNQLNLVNGSNGFVMYGCNAPTGNLVDAFQMADGSEFSDHYQVDANGYYQNVSGKYTSANMYYNREPRFYAEIVYDSAVWQKRFADLAGRDPLGIYDRRTRIVKQGGQEVSKIFGIDTRQGPIDGDDGTYTGYIFKKYLDDQVYGTETTDNENAWFEFRYAEILMNYAEACLELGEIGEATDYINMIRNRSGLPDFVGDPMKALRYERRIEFIYEDIRWYDMRRWKILDETLANVYGVDINEVTNLDNNTVTTTWQKIPVMERGPVNEKLYWIPISIDEMNRAPSLQQNPGY